MNSVTLIRGEVVDFRLVRKTPMTPGYMAYGSDDEMEEAFEEWAERFLVWAYLISKQRRQPNTTIDAYLFITAYHPRGRRPTRRKVRLMASMLERSNMVTLPPEFIDPIFGATVNWEAQCPVSLTGDGYAHGEKMWKALTRWKKAKWFARRFFRQSKRFLQNVWILSLPMARALGSRLQRYWIRIAAVLLTLILLANAIDAVKTLRGVWRHFTSPTQGS